MGQEEQAVPCSHERNRRLEGWLMAQEEKYGVRDLTYSTWHRRFSLERYVAKAYEIAMIDIDSIEYDWYRNEPLALIETAMDVGQDWKSVTITRKLAIKAGLPVYILLYTLSDEPNPAKPIYQDISLFRYKKIWPEPESKWITVLPQGWADILVEMRVIARDSWERELQNGHQRTD